MSQFKIGGKVVVIQGAIIGGTRLEDPITIHKDEIYNVEDLKVCECGAVKLHIGFVRKKIPGYVQNHQCSACNARTETLIAWISSKYFLPIEEQEFKQVLYTKIIDEIPVCAQ